MNDLGDDFDYHDPSVSVSAVGGKPMPRIVLTHKESDLYMKMKTYIRGTSDSIAIRFWDELKKRKSYKDWHNGSIFVLDADFVKDNLDHGDRLFAQVMWNMLEATDEESKLYLKMKWNFL